MLCSAHAQYMTLPCRPLKLTGKKRRCLNLGSYNYLGYANADPYCTPMVIKTMEQYGWGMCSSRIEAGEPALWPPELLVSRAATHVSGCSR